MTELNKFQKWVDSRRPKVKPKIEVEEICKSTPEEEFKEAWREWKDAFKVPIFIFKFGLYSFGALIFIWALSVMNIQNDCYLDKECKAQIERVNR